MLGCMYRTNIYLTEEQELALDFRARLKGTTRSAVLRQIIDADLGTGQPDSGIECAFAELADHYDELVIGLFDDDPDLRIDT